MLVLVTDGEMSVRRTREDLDRIGSMVGIARIDRVRVFDGLVEVDVTVVTGCNDEHADE